MDNIIDLNFEQEPLNRLEAETAEPKKEYLFTTKEGEILAGVLKRSMPLFSRFVGCPRTASLERSVGLLVDYVEMCAKEALGRRDFALVPIWNHGRMTLDAVKMHKVNP